MQRRTALFAVAGAALTTALDGWRGPARASATAGLSPGLRLRFLVEHRTTTPSSEEFRWRSEQILEIVAPHADGLLARLTFVDGDSAPLNDPMAPLMARLHSGFTRQTAVIHLTSWGRPLAMFGWREHVSRAFANAAIHRRDASVEPVTFDLDFAKRAITTIPSRISGAFIAEHVCSWSLAHELARGSDPTLSAPWGDPVSLSSVSRNKVDSGSDVASATMHADAGAMRSALEALYRRTYLGVSYRKDLERSLPPSPSMRCELKARLGDGGLAADVSLERAIEMGPAWPAREAVDISVSRV